MVKFNKSNVTDTETGITACVFYTLDQRVDRRKCVTIHAQDYGQWLNLGDILCDACMPDFFVIGRAEFFQDHPLYQQARECAEAIKR